ncbi:hypothetical protein EB74_17235 [Mycobacterium sp. SWH-M5]|nr:hypothetical protein EB74_17235 [Mycobacterium sp. SWH-M5]
MFTNPSRIAGASEGDSVGNDEVGVETSGAESTYMFVYGLSIAATFWWRRQEIVAEQHADEVSV